MCFCAALLDAWHRNKTLGVRVTLAPSHLWLSDFTSWHNPARSICPCLPTGINAARSLSKALCYGPAPHVLPSLPHSSTPERQNAWSDSATKTNPWVFVLLSQHRGAAMKYGQLFCLATWMLLSFEESFSPHPRNPLVGILRRDSAFYTLTYKPAANGLGYTS